jgi:hypothetical protein
MSHEEIAVLKERIDNVIKAIDKLTGKISNIENKYIGLNTIVLNMNSEISREFLLLKKNFKGFIKEKIRDKKACDENNKNRVERRRGIIERLIYPMILVVFSIIATTFVFYFPKILILLETIKKLKP